MEELSTPIKNIHRAIRARFPALWMESHEEARALDEIADLCATAGVQLFIWSLASGLRRRLPPAASLKAKGATEEKLADASPEEVLEHIVEAPSEGGDKLFVLCELDELMTEDVFLRRKFRELAEAGRNIRTNKHLLVLTPRGNSVPLSLEKTVTLVEFPVPTREQHHARVTRMISKYKSKNPETVKIDDAGVEQLVNAATGLTHAGLRRALAVALSEYKCFDSRCIDLVAEEKRRLVDGTGFLQYEEPSEGLSDVGGQDLLKKWLSQRMKAFGEDARKYGLTEPKGVLTVGPPGTGKSLGAKAASSAWRRPLLRLDVGALFGGLVGESEQNTRKAIQLIEAMSPCVLWIDEIEKGLSGMSSSGATDGGTTARVFQSLLTWLNEKKSAVFVYATANDPSKLPPELLRKGRLDEIFAISLPSQPEREDIFAIHIAKRKRDPTKFDLQALAANTRGFSGAEIEQCVLDAMFAAFYEDREFEAKDILDAIEGTQPMSKTMRERIIQMREWAETRARAASSLRGQELAMDNPTIKNQSPEDDMLDILS